MAFSPDGRILAVGGGTTIPTPGTADAPVETGIVQLWDLETRAATGRFDSPSHEVRSLAFYPEGASLAIGDPSRVRVVDARTGVPKFAVPRASWDSIGIDPRNRVLAIDSGLFWDMATGDARPCFVRTSLVEPAFSPDGRYFVTSGTVWDVRTQKAIGGVEGSRWAFSHDSRFQGTETGTWDLDRRLPVCTAPGGVRTAWTRVTGVLFTPDDRFLLVSDAGGDVMILESATGVPAGSFHARPWVAGMAMTTDGRRLASSPSKGEPLPTPSRSGGRRPGRRIEGRAPLRRDLARHPRVHRRERSRPGHRGAG